MYDQQANLIKHTINKCWKLPQQDLKYGILFKDPHKFAYRKGKTLGTQLIKSDLRTKKVFCQKCLNTQKRGTFS